MYKFSKSIIAGLLLTIHAVSVFAAADIVTVEHEVNTPANIDGAADQPVKAAYLLLKKGKEVNLNDTAILDRQIAFYTGDALRDHDILTFSVQCKGAIKADTKVHIFAYDTNTSTSRSGWVRIGTYRRAESTDDEGNYKKVKIEIQESGIEAGDNFQTYDGGTTGPIGGAKEVPGNTLLVLSESPTTHDPITIIPQEGIPIGCLVTVSLDEIKTLSGLSLAVPATSTTVVESICSLSGNIGHYENDLFYDGVATSEINVSEEVQRSAFNDESGASEWLADTYTDMSRFEIAITNKAELGLDINNSGQDKFTVCLQRENYDGIEEVVLLDHLGGGQDIECPWNASVKGYWCDKVPLNEYILKNLPPDADGNPRLGISVGIRITEQEALSPGMWKVSFKVHANEIEDELTLFSCMDATYWFLDGIQFIIPYFYADEDYGTYIVMTNIGDTAADVYMDVVSDQGRNEGAEGEQYQNIKLPSIPARSTKTYFPVTSPVEGDVGIVDAVNRDYPAFEGNRFLGKFTVAGAKPDNIQAAAFQKDGPGTTSKRSIPVLFQGGGQARGDNQNQFRE